MVVSKFMKDKMISFGFSTNNIEIDKPKIDPQFKNFKWDRPIDVLYLGGQKEYKGYKLFLAAKKRMKNIKILGIYNVPFQKMVEIYNKSKVLLVPSLWEEPLGLVSLEAKACGCKVVASNIGGLPETHPDYLFEPGNVTEMIMKINEALKSYN